MIEIIKNIKGTVFKANVESYLSKQAEALIDLISEIELDNSKIDEKVQVGWNIYLISKKNDGVHIFDFTHES